MDKQNKLIVGLMILVLLLTAILLLKTTKTVQEIDETTIENHTLEENQQNIERPKDYMVIKKIVWTIADILMVLVFMPMILKKWDLVISVVILTFYKVLETILINGVSSGAMVLIVVTVFLLFYAFILLYLMKRYLLNLKPVIFVIATMVLEGIIYHSIVWMFSWVAVNFLV